MSAVAPIAAPAAVQIANTATGQPGGSLAAALPGLKPGQVVLAQVLGPGEGGATRVSIGGQQLEVILPRPAEAGTVLRFHVQAQGQGQSQGAEAKLLLLPSSAGSAGAGAGSAAATSQPAATATFARSISDGPVREALLQGARVSLGKQDSLAPLFASLAGAQGRSLALPAAVTSAITQLLALRLNADGKPLSGDALKGAIQKSGIFLEARQASSVPAPAGDLKAALLSLRVALAGWVGTGATPTGKAGQRPVPPLRGVPPRGQPGQLPLTDGIEDKALAGKLLEQTEAALSRVRLSQMASLPDGHAPKDAGRAPPAEWQFELPLYAGGQTGAAQFRLTRDCGGDADVERGGREWRMEVAVDLAGTGPVHADVTFRQQVIGIALLAEREEAADALREALPELGDALAAQGLTLGKLSCREGAPVRTVPAAGLFMDEAS